jgi:hypothetical protein
MLIFDNQIDILQYSVQAWNCNATSLSEGPEKTFDDRYGYSSPRYMRENHYAVLVIFENFSGFHSQEFSITLLQILKCLEGSFLSPNAKI